MSNLSEVLEIRYEYPVEGIGNFFFILYIYFFLIYAYIFFYFSFFPVHYGWQPKDCVITIAQWSGDPDNSFGKFCWNFKNILIIRYFLIIFFFLFFSFFF